MKHDYDSKQNNLISREAVQIKEKIRRDKQSVLCTFTAKIWARHEPVIFLSKSGLLKKWLI